MSFKVQTNAIALSRAWTALNMVESASIPELGDDVEEMATIVVMNLGANEMVHNMFFRGITGEKNHNFNDLSIEEAVEITTNFFKGIGEKSLSLIKKQLVESKKRKDLAISKMTEQATDQIMNSKEGKAHLNRILKSL